MKRTATFTLLALILTSAVFAVTALPNGRNLTVMGQAGTSVGGTLWGDTTWSPSGSPYTLTSDLTVAQNSTLTIMPGTVVNLALSSFIIDGTLNARGTENNRIVFQAQKRLTESWPPRIYFNDSSTPWNQNTGTGCIIDYAQVNVPNYQYETILGTDPMISNNIIYNYGDDAAAVRTNGYVVNNTILGGYRGIDAQFNDVILSNTIEGASVGISCGFMSSDPIYHPTIIGNVLVNNSVGIDDWSCDPYIANNTIASNGFGFDFSSYTFDRGAVPVAIVDNNLYDNNHNVLVGFTDQNTVNMTNNWWGTTSASLIAQSIYDNTTDPNLTKINYTPFLTQPNSEVTAISITTPIPSPSPAPTNSTTPVATPTPAPEPTSTSPTSTLNLSCDSSTSSATFNVDINGNLSFNGQGVPNVPISISYTVVGSNYWQLLTGVDTASDGSFSVEWHPSVTGDYIIDASYAGGQTCPSASAVVNLAIMPFETQNAQDIFSVASNSPITNLAFNSTNRELSFIVSGSSSVGYVDAYVAKSLIPDISSLKVYLDGRQVTYTVASEGESWLIHFTCGPSDQTAVLSLGSEASKPTVAAPVELIALIIIAVIVIVLVIAFLRRRDLWRP